MKRSITQTNYTEMGMASMIPGMQLALDVLQKALEDLRAQLAGFQETGDLRTRYKGSEGHAVQGTPEHSSKMARGVSSYWAKMDREERSAEVKRRRAVARGEGSPVPALSNKRLSVSGLRRGTPEYRAVDAHNKRLARDERKAALSAANKAKSQAAKDHWANMSKAAQKRHIAMMNTARAKAVEARRHVNGAA